MSGAFELKLLDQCVQAPQQKKLASHGGSKERSIQKMAPKGLAALDANTLVNDPDLDTGGTTQSETTVVAAGNVVCAAWNDSGEGYGMNGFSGFGHSQDGGLTFVDGGPFPNGPDDTNFGDPSLAYSLRDNAFYYASLSSWGLSLWRSDDSCQSFSYVGAIHEGYGDDKELMAIDNNPSSPYYGRIYVGWTDFAAYDDANTATFSDDGGETWSSARYFPGSGSDGQGVYPAVAPNGDVFMALVDRSYEIGGLQDQRIYRSNDGGETWSEMTPIGIDQLQPENPASSSACGRQALNGDIRNLSSPQIVVSADGAAPEGYIVHAVYPYDSDGTGTDNSNVFYRQSLDGGETWSEEVQLNDDATTTDQFYPALGLDESGTLVASWYDRRLDPDENLLIDRFATYSVDGGQTWSANERISDASAPVGETNPQFDGLARCYHGDYDQVAISGSIAHVVWSDDRRITSTGPNPDVYYGQLVVNPSLGRVRAETSVVSCSGSITWVLSDADLAGAGSQDIELTTTTGDLETLALTESATEQGTFSGSIGTSPAAVAIGNGMLELADGATATATYEDADDGNGEPAVATSNVNVDCAAPLVTGVDVVSLSGRRATVEVSASEPVSLGVAYGYSCDSLGRTVTSGVSITPQVTLTELLSGYTYYYSVALTDRVGNTTTLDNGGSCYSLTTLQTVYREDFESGLDAFTLHNGEPGGPGGEGGAPGSGGFPGVGGIVFTGGFPGMGGYPTTGGFPAMGGYPTTGGFPFPGGVFGAAIDAGGFAGEVPAAGGFPTMGGFPDEGGFAGEVPGSGGFPGLGGFPDAGGFAGEVPTTAGFPNTGGFAEGGAGGGPSEWPDLVPHNGLWHLTDTCASQVGGHSSSHSLYFGVDGICTFETRYSSAGTATSPVIHLGDASFATLEFNYFLGTEGGGYYDQATVEISIDGGPFTTVQSNFTELYGRPYHRTREGASPAGRVALNENTGQWERASIDLVPLLEDRESADLVIRFTFDTIDSALNGFAGFYVDDLELLGSVHPRSCTGDSDCDDGLYCNGTETCINEVCAKGLPVQCPESDSVDCTDDVCDEATHTCVSQPNDARCDDGDFCNGFETCDATLGCQAASGLSCPEDDVSCTTATCIEMLKACTQQADDSLCDDGLFCTGWEYCDPTLDCQSSGPPCDDGIGCTEDVCNEEYQYCEAVPDDARCDDGQFCTGQETCEMWVGCRSGGPPCSASESCNEIENACVQTCFTDTNANHEAANRAYRKRYTYFALGSKDRLGRAADITSLQGGDGYFEQVAACPEPPSIDSLQVSVHGEAVTISGQASDVNGDIEKVRITVSVYDYLDFTVDAAGTQQFATEVSLPVGYHSATAEAIDEQGQSSGASERIYFYVEQPLPPIVESLEASVAGDAVTLSGVASDPNNDIEFVSLAVLQDGEIIATGIANGTDEFSGSIAGLAPGSYQAWAQAFDEEGFVSDPSAPVDFTIEEQATACVAATNSEHAAAGRAIFVWSKRRYAAVGSGDPLGRFGWVTTSLSGSGDYWSRVKSCP